MEDSNSVRGNWTIKRIINIFPKGMTMFGTSKLKCQPRSIRDQLQRLWSLTPHKDTRTDESTIQFRMRKLPSLGQRGVPSYCYILPYHNLLKSPHNDRINISSLIMFWMGFSFSRRGDLCFTHASYINKSVR